MRVRYIKHTLNGSDKNPSCHFVEIEAFTSNNTNVALNKTCTSDVPPTGLSKPISCITDGDKLKDNYFNVEGSKATVTVDLGQIYDVKRIKVYHYGDGRKYKDNIVKVSPDGIHYETMFDSNVDGEYVEVETGKELILPAEYKPFVDVVVSDNNLLIDVIQNGSVVENVTIGLRGSTIDEIEYKGSQIVYPIHSSILAYGVNDFEVMAHTSTVTNISRGYCRYTYNVSNLGLDANLATVSNHVSNVSNTNERNRNDLQLALLSKGVNADAGDGITDLIGKIPNIALGKKWASGTNVGGAINTGLVVNTNLSFNPSVYHVYIEEIQVIGGYRGICRVELKSSKANSLTECFSAWAKTTSSNYGEVKFWIENATSNRFTINSSISTVKILNITWEACE